jgi:photosystem II stability/assembly factor-like uncharacterized protein
MSEWTLRGFLGTRNNPWGEMSLIRRQTVRLARVALAIALLTVGLIVANLAYGQTVYAGASTASWTSSVQYPAAIETVQAISCQSALDCIAVGSGVNGGGGEAIFGTTDGGTSWNDQTSPGELPTGSTFNAITCASSEVCEAVGEIPGGNQPVIASTADGGTTWSSQKFPSLSANLYAVACPSISECVAVGTGSPNGSSFGLILQTTNAGGTWNQQAISSATQLKGVSCPSPQVCTAVGSAPLNVGIILGTGNGGGTWSSESFPSLGTTNGAGALTAVSCAAVGNCVAVGLSGVGSGYGAVLTTSDGGATWAAQYVSSAFGVPNSISCPTTAVCETAGEVNTSCCSGQLAGTTDGGATWDIQSNPSGAGGGPLFLTVNCPTTATCFSGGQLSSTNLGAILVTNDGGLDWADKPTPVGILAVTASACANRLTCMVVGRGSSGLGVGGVALLSQDAGTTWTSSTLPVFDPQAVSCPSSSICLVGGYSPPSGTSSGGIAETTDGGTTWTTLLLPLTATTIDSIACPSTDICIAVGDEYNPSTSSSSPVALKTIDGGSTWASVPALSAVNPTAVTCPSISECVGMGTKTAWTNDGGVTWNTTSNPIGGYLPSTISCPSVTVCYVAGSSTIASSNDGGAQWTSTTIGGLFQPLTTITCPSVTSCQAGGASVPSFYSTTDGGTHWLVSSLPVGSTGVATVACPSTSICIAPGSNTFNGASMMVGVLPPSIATVSPNTGTSDGHQLVTITGDNLGDATGVSFGSIPSVSFTVDSESQITAVAPTVLSGTVDVTVTTPEGTTATSSDDAFTFFAVPAVTAVTPSPSTAGNTITITGTGFVAPASVVFGTSQATFVSVLSSTQINAVAPAGFGTVDVSVSTPGGTSPISFGDRFTYIPPPTVTNLSPKSGPDQGGTVVTIGGSNLGSAIVTFAGIWGTVTSDNGTSMTIITPPGNDGPVDVVVTTAAGIATDSGAFTYGSSCSSPIITSPDTTRAVAGTAFTFKVTACSASVPLIKASHLPMGLHLTDNYNGTATISGTPAAHDSGAYTSVIMATVGHEPVTMQTLVVTVEHAPLFKSRTKDTVHTGTAFAYPITTAYGYPIPTITTSSTLPGGVNLVDNGNGTGELEGTPDANAGGPYSVVITAANFIGALVTQTFTLTVDQAPVITSEASDSVTAGTAMAPFNVTDTAYPIATLKATGLPTGLHLVDNHDGTGTISGTTKVTAAGTYEAVITAKSKAGTITEAFALTVI